MKRARLRSRTVSFRTFAAFASFFAAALTSLAALLAALLALRSSLLIPPTCSPPSLPPLPPLLSSPSVTLLLVFEFFVFLLRFVDAVASSSLLLPSSPVVLESSLPAAPNSRIRFLLFLFLSFFFLTSLAWTLSAPYFLLRAASTPVKDCCCSAHFELPSPKGSAAAPIPRASIFFATFTCSVVPVSSLPNPLPAFQPIFISIRWPKEDVSSAHALFVVSSAA
mmetsp:Transcript_28577/g.57541  ORF Transcript_28577/g.57541 Transcript_28577/m.57541 type:complete len:223 (+) Transcript_28577:255-923(+)